MKPLAAALLLFALNAPAQTTPAVPDPFQPLAFVTGTWNASTAQGSSSPTAIGTYTFYQLKGSTPSEKIMSGKFQMRMPNQSD